MDRTEKREFVTSLADVFAATSMVVVTQNKGMTVAEVTVLRTRMRAAGATFRVAKNRLATLALDGTRFDGIKPMLKGPTALAWSDDPVAVAKVAVEFARTNEKLVLVGGALGTQTLNADGVKALAELPSLDTLRGKLVGLIAAPATRIAGVLPGTGRAARAGPRGLCKQGRGVERRDVRGGGCLRHEIGPVRPGLHGTDRPSSRNLSNGRPDEDR